MAKQELSKEALIALYLDNKLKGQRLGQLRRLILEDILSDIQSSTDDEARQWLDGKQSKIDRAKLATAVGYGTQVVNLRQSFNAEIKKAEAELKQRNVINTKAKTNKQIRDDNAEGFLLFLEERLQNSDYNWPVNLKGRLYQRVIYAMYLDQNVDEIVRAPAFFFEDARVKAALSNIDVALANDDLKKRLDYASESALDERQNTMTSSALSTMRQQLKGVKEALAVEREERRKLEKHNAELVAKNTKLEKQINQYTNRDEALISVNQPHHIKLAGVH